MKILFVVCVVTSLFVQETAGICQGYNQRCSYYDADLNCCNGFKCKMQGLFEKRCMPINCQRRGQECGMMKWCCPDLQCKQRAFGYGYECRRY